MGAITWVCDHGFLERDLLSSPPAVALFDFIVSYGWYIATAIAAYIYGTVKYAIMAFKAEATPTIASVTVKGGLAATLGDQAGVLIDSQQQQVSELFRNMRITGDRLIVREGVGRELQEILTFVETYFQLPITDHYPNWKTEVKKDLVVKVGGYEIPVGAMFELFISLFRWIRIPFRSKYEDALIRVSLLSSGKETQLVVSRNRHGERAGEGAPDGQRVLTKIVPTEKLSDLTDLLGDAAFMIQQLFETNEIGMRWQQRRHFVDGLRCLDQYLRTGDQMVMEEAKAGFQHAVNTATTDPDSAEALYAYGSLLMFERKPETIDLAITLFDEGIKLLNGPNHGLSPEFQQKLEALINSGLAFCYVQLMHRFAQSSDEVRRKAEYHARNAENCWPSAKDQVHPLIQSRLFLAIIIDDGDYSSLEKREAAIGRTERSIPHIVRAIDGQPRNWTFHNMLGWAYLKAVEWDMELEVSDKPGWFADQVKGIAPMSEWSFKKAIELNPDNKLSQANLCLLYSAPYFRKMDEEKDSSKYRNLCRYHGKKAIVLDPGYINGHRDMAIGMIRYGDNEPRGEAYKYFLRAMELADAPNKDDELMRDIKQELIDSGTDVNDPIMDPWLSPELSVFDPKDSKPVDLHPEPVPESK